MGTVGLSFGSATGGTGFDVSSTVSTIVANLQKVETPWKNQLTSLQSQDSVISNLGTLLSNLSNDVSQLTDFSGIMAQKTGSSSDTNVLQLTAATSSAVAGTHSVVVNNLAATSSGYMTEVPSASTPLAIGSTITLQVGSGATDTITIDSTNNTLTTLAAAINNSGVGITASVLTDSTGARLSLVSGTSGANGNITVSGNTLAAATPITYSSTSTTTGTLTGIPSATDTLSMGSVTIQTAGNTAQTITLNSTNNTLNGLMSAINSNAALTAQGVSAVITTTGGVSTLSLTSTGTALSVGTSNLTDNSATTFPLGYTSTVTGKDASLTVDGVSLSSSSNTVSNLIPGVTFQLLSQSPQVSGSPEQVQVVIGNDNTSIESTIANMVNDYNSLMSAIHVQTGNTSSGTPEPLFGSPTLSLLQQQMMSALNTQNPNGTLTTIAADTASTTTTLTGTMSIQVGSGTAQTITIPTGGESLQALASQINAANIGVTASVKTVSGQSTLALLSQTTGSAGSLTVTTSLTATDSSNNTKPITYTNSSNISTLTNLGISVSSKDDGSLTFDAGVLDSMLNTNYSGVIGFFQSINSWGQTFAQTLNNAGNTSSTGTLKLAQNSNSNIESTLNADISRQESLISVQQKSLTAELNSANEILQSIPTQLQGVNEIYSAITGYNTKQG